MKVMLVIVALLVGGSSPLAAEPVSVETGARVRVKIPGHPLEVVEGTLVGLDRESLVLDVEKPNRASGRELELPRDRITEFGVHQGQKSFGWWKGALVGVLGGAALGAGMAAVSSSRDSYYGLEVAAGAVFVGAIGGFVGGITGAVKTTDHWVDVPLDHIHASFVPQRNGFAFALCRRR